MSKRILKTAAITLTLLTAYVALMAMPVPAQTNVQSGGSIPLPSGVTPNVSYNTIAHMSFRPNPIGVGQPLLVNVWLQPPTHVSRYFKGYVVKLTKPDGTTTSVGPMDSYLGDTTAWFEYIMDQLGTWKIQFDFPGGFFPAGNYTVPGGAYAGGQTLNAPLSIYYKPSTDGPYDIIVQQEPALSYPGSPLPTDYWSRPVSVENREWWPILGNYPGTGVVAGVGRGVSLGDWPADTNKYMSNYGYTPYVQGPKSAHIVWKRQGADGGLIGGTMGEASWKTGGGGPSIIFNGRCYQSLTKVAKTLVNGTYYDLPTNVWQCYDLQTGQVFWEQTGIGNQAPSMILYSEREVDVVPGETASTEAIRADLMYVGGGRLITYNAWTGAVNWNFSIAPLTTGTYYASYDWPYFLTVQTLGSGASAQYRLINWTVGGDPSGFTLGKFRLGVAGNVSWPFSSSGVVDYEAGIAVVTSGITPSSVGVAYGQMIMAANIKTGQLLWNISTDTSTGLNGFFSGSTAVADHGKYAVRLNDGHWHCWDLYTGRELWQSELSSWPWGTFGAYGVQSFGGNIISNQYDGVLAYNWTNGKISWWYKDKAEFPYETPFGDNNPWFTGTARIADGVLYTYNTEHSPSQPIMRGLKLHAINITTGEGIWNISGNMSPGGVADGYLTASNSYDGYMYVFGKGKSSTTVTAPQTSVPKGTEVLIQGTVLDQSPAQPGTPCVSRDSMGTYMAYLHMQKAIPSDVTVTGVPVALLALDAKDAVTTIGTTTSDMSGKFSFAWTPPAEGTYKITATFAGDDSYGSSWGETGLLVGPAPAEVTIPEQAAPIDYTMAIIGTGIAVIIAVAIAAVLMLRKK